MRLVRTSKGPPRGRSDALPGARSIFVVMTDPCRRVGLHAGFAAALGRAIDEANDVAYASPDASLAKR